MNTEGNELLAQFKLPIDRLFYYKWELAEAVGLRSIRTLKKELSPLIEAKAIQWDTPYLKDGKRSQRKMLTKCDTLVIIHYLEEGIVPSKKV